LRLPTPYLKDQSLILQLFYDIKANYCLSRGNLFQEYPALERERSGGIQGKVKGKRGLARWANPLEKTGVPRGILMLGNLIIPLEFPVKVA
jgi:hypothetical protein